LRLAAEPRRLVALIEGAAADLGEDRPPLGRQLFEVFVEAEEGLRGGSLERLLLVPAHLTTPSGVPDPTLPGPPVDSS
jgi:hypothetical protein